MRAQARWPPENPLGVPAREREQQRVEMVRMLNLLAEQVNFLTKTAAEQAGVIEALEQRVDALTKAS
jgi:predicted RecB family endonuclease